MVLSRSKSREDPMNRVAPFGLIVVVVLGFSILLAACGSGGGDSNAGVGAVTSLSTTTQGAQSAAASVASARSIASTGVQLSNIASTGGILAVPRFKAFAGTSTQSTAINKFAASFSPVVKKTALMRASNIGFPIALSCVSGATGTVLPLSNNSMTIDMDMTGTNFTITFTQCKDASTYKLTDGVMNIAGAINSGVFTIGSASRLFTVTDYTSSTMTTTVDKSQANITMSFSSTGTTLTTMDTISASGSFENWDYVLHTHDLETLTNLSITVASTTTTINSASYNVDTLTIGGSKSGTAYASDTNATVNYNDTSSFSNFVVAYKTPASGMGNDYLTINGTFNIATTPLNNCIDGTFSITTDNDIQIDSSGVTQAGLVTINSNVGVTFLGGGAVQVSVNGGATQTYTALQVDSVCAL